MRATYKLWAVVLLVVVCRTAQADTVEDVIRAEMEKQHIPGLSLAVIKEGKVVKVQGYGLANVELNVPATADTVYEIGSITKQFTATAVMMLVEEGKIGVDDKITKYLDGLPDAWNEVTVRHLLTHTSGIRSYTSLPGFGRMTVLPTTLDEVVKAVSARPMEFQPGEKWSYNNTGFFLLGSIIEKAGGKPYAQFLKERIFDPLQMTSTSVNDQKRIVKNRASGYAWENNTLANADYIHMSWPYAAGAILSSVNDMAKWDAALYTDKLLKTSSLDQMWTPVRLNGGTTHPYGFGWGVSDYRGHRNVSHGGGIPGFITFESRFPDDRLTVIVLTNIGPSNPEAICKKVAGLVLPGLSPVSQITPQTDPDKKRTEQIRQTLADAMEGKETPLATAGWLASLKAAPAGAKAQRSSLLKEAKEFTFIASEEISKPGLERLGGRVSRLAYYKMVTARPTVYWTFYLDTNGKILDAIPEVG